MRQAVDRAPTFVRWFRENAERLIEADSAHIDRGRSSRIARGDAEFLKHSRRGVREFVEREPLGWNLIEDVRERDCHDPILQ